MVRIVVTNWSNITAGIYNNNSISYSKDEHIYKIVKSITEKLKFTLNYYDTFVRHISYQ